MRRNFYFLLFSAGLISTGNAYSQSQKRVVIMGSSSAAGAGASSYANSWAGKIIAYYNKNATDGLDTVFYNIGYPGYDSYREMPTGFIPPPENPPRWLPDPLYNISKAVSYNPHIIILNLPSNDMYNGIPKEVTMRNFRVMRDTAFAHGAKFFVCTTQPRNDLWPNGPQWQRDLVDSINAVFGPYAIDFWTDLVTTSGTPNLLRDPVRDPNSAYHINDLGHNYLFIRVRDKNIFSSFNIPLPLRLTEFRAKAKNQTTLLEWHTEQEEPNTSFDIQRSSDGIRFETLYNQPGQGSFTAASYAWTDQHPLPNKSFYRLRIIENGQSTYSKVVSVTNKVSEITIANLYKDNSSANLVATINVQKNQQVILSIVDMSGAVVHKQTQYITTPAKTIFLPIGKLAAGQYFLNIRSTDNNAAVMGFIK